MMTGDYVGPSGLSHAAGTLEQDERLAPAPERQIYILRLFGCEMLLKSRRGISSPLRISKSRHTEYL